MESENAFKNWINPSVVRKLAKVFKASHPDFNIHHFQKLILKLNELELKGRVLLLTQGLAVELPEDFRVTAKILKQVIRKKQLQGFELWPISEYISQYGTDHFDESMDLMYWLTQQFTAEFAIRPFLQNDPKRVLKKLGTWIQDENVHVRRWLSEGTRPILPWGGKIQSFIKQPATIPLLESLKFDEALYVRKSVANHLNDISKDHPELVVKTLKRWVETAPPIHATKIEWIKKHALRTLIKKGHKGALRLMGVRDDLSLKISGFKLNKKEFKVGDSLEFEFVLQSTGLDVQKIIVDYGLGFVKSNGSLSTKIFKLKTMSIHSKQKVHFKKKHSLKVITTSTFYSGRHELCVHVNGKVLKRVKWDFKVNY
ncbi:MAG: hypothetical protein K2P81_08595 [Bacteriovoracaceae bacterium]|nr:hypothetical protein [Bacteriovoracaceae bacterium]